MLAKDVINFVREYHLEDCTVEDFDIAMYVTIELDDHKSIDYRLYRNGSVEIWYCVKISEEQIDKLEKKFNVNDPNDWFIVRINHAQANFIRDYWNKKKCIFTPELKAKEMLMKLLYDDHCRKNKALRDYMLGGTSK